MSVNKRSLTFTNATGQELAARLQLPMDGEPLAYAIFAHCFTCTKDLHAVSRIGEALAKRGFGLLSFDFTGLGQSEGDFGETSFSSTVSDLVSAASFLSSEYRPPQLLIGHSLGGAGVLAAAGQIDSVEAVTTIGAPCDPDHVRGLLREAEEEINEKGRATVDIGGRPFSIGKQFLDDLDSYDSMKRRIREIDAAILVFHSPQDKIVGIEQARHIYEAAKHPKSFVTLDGADHLLTDPEDSRYVAEVLAAWAGRYITHTQLSAISDEPMPKPYDDPTVTVTTPGDSFRTEITTRGHSLLADEPEKVGGTETGPTPYDLLAAALGACTTMTIKMYAARKKWPLESVTCRVAFDRVHADDCETCETKTGRIDRLTRTLEFEGEFDEEQRAKLLEIADKCPVHRTLHSEILVETSLA